MPHADYESMIGVIEKRLQLKLWPKGTPRVLANSPERIEIVQRIYRLISEEAGLIGTCKDNAGQVQTEAEQKLHDVREQILFVFQLLRAPLCSDTHQPIEVAGHRVKLVASNIRQPDFNWSNTELSKEGKAHEGDLALAEVTTDSGSTIRIEDYYGRDERIYRGDRVIVVFGNRRTGTSEFGEIPEEGWNISSDNIVDLMCHGGIVGCIREIPARMIQTPTRLKVLGLLQEKGRNLNLCDLFPEWDRKLKPSAPIIANLGSGAELGKTTTAAVLIRALKAQGLIVAASKMAGTGRYRDLLELRDAGADIFLDFPDVGLPSTYTTAERYIPAIRTLINRLNEEAPDVIVAEFGGDIIEANIPTFLQHPEFKPLVQAILHSSGDILSMKGSCDYYRKWGFSPDNIPFYLTYPKGRNNYGSSIRIQEQLNLPAFDNQSDREATQVIQNVFNRISLEKISPPNY
ncbi:NAD-dependent epimerase/dehydratase family protein [Patescibacteria group bacterium]|nr:NAD-dependent epimerase/dehydratase family protein [Patescibacteria group bacterium]